MKNDESIYYYKDTGFQGTVIQTQPTESYRDATSSEYPWTDPTPPDQSCVWVRHKHVMKNEPDGYYFTRLESDNLDIIWTTPSEKCRDAGLHKSY